MRKTVRSSLADHRQLEAYNAQQAALAAQQPQQAAANPAAQQAGDAAAWAAYYAQQVRPKQCFLQALPLNRHGIRQSA